jgi:putative flippase GtrA
MLENRAVQALRQPANWIQLAKFGCVGASGYLLNLAVYAGLLHALKGSSLQGADWFVAATVSFLVAASWNYWWNRHWTFREQRGSFTLQGVRFFTVSAIVYLANIGLLRLLISNGFGKIEAQAVAVIVVMPLNFLGNKLWSFRS